MTEWWRSKLFFAPHTFRDLNVVVTWFPSPPPDGQFTIQLFLFTFWQQCTCSLFFCFLLHLTFKLVIVFCIYFVVGRLDQLNYIFSFFMGRLRLVGLRLTIMDGLGLALGLGLELGGSVLGLVL